MPTEMFTIIWAETSFFVHHFLFDKRFLDLITAKTKSSVVNHVDELWTINANNSTAESYWFDQDHMKHKYSWFYYKWKLFWVLQHAVAQPLLHIEAKELSNSLYLQDKQIESTKNGKNRGEF